MPLNKKQLLRMTLFCTLLKENSYPNAISFAQYLRKRDLDRNENVACSEKSILRDIYSLRHDFHAPIEFDREHNGYYLVDRQWTWQCPSLGDAAVMAAILARHAAVSIYPPSLSAKIDDQLAGQIAASQADPLEKAFIGSLVIASGCKVPILSEVFQAVFDAWRGHRVISFDYASPWHPERQGEPRRLEPHVLGLRNGAWYALGREPGTGKERTFALHRMARVMLGRDGFVPDQKLVRRGMAEGPYLHGELSNVVLSCTADIGDFVREREPSWTVSPDPEAKDRCRLSIPRIHDQELIPWILLRRGKATLLSHPEIREKLAAIGRQLHESHRG